MYSNIRNRCKEAGRHKTKSPDRKSVGALWIVKNVKRLFSARSETRIFVQAQVSPDSEKTVSGWTLFDSSQCRIVIGLLGDLRNLLGIGDLPLGVQHDNGARKKASQRSGGDGYTIVFAKIG